MWVADLTYVAISASFVYVAVILDAWSRRVIGYAISKRIDTRLALAALRAATHARQPPPDYIHHSDRGAQYASATYRQALKEHGLRGSMGRHGNPYDNAKVSWPASYFSIQSRIMKLARSTHYYRSRRSAAEKTALHDRIVELSAEFPRYRYWRVTHQLRAEGLLVITQTALRFTGTVRAAMELSRRVTARSAPAVLAGALQHASAEDQKTVSFTAPPLKM